MKVALVTGAGRGLGASIARTLAARGWAVAVNDLHPADDVVAEIVAAGGVAVSAPGDVTSEAVVPELVSSVVSQLGPVGCLVANATGPQPTVPFAELTWQTHLDQLSFFVKSPTLLAQAVVPGMRSLGFGRIVNMGSDMPDRALVGWSAYSAAKAGLVAMSRVWARELGALGITVNVVAPGWIPVERHAGVSFEDYLGKVPLGRIGAPGDVAAAVAFLASEEAGFVTGQVLAVNGGHTIVR